LRMLNIIVLSFIALLPGDVKPTEFARIRWRVGSQVAPRLASQKLWGFLPRRCCERYFAWFQMRVCGSAGRATRSTDVKGGVEPPHSRCFAHFHVQWLQAGRYCPTRRWKSFCADLGGRQFGTRGMTFCPTSARGPSICGSCRTRRVSGMCEDYRNIHDQVQRSGRMHREIM